MQSIFAITTLLFFFPITVRPDCQIDPLRIMPTPLVANSQKEILYPDSRTRVVNIPTGEEITIACPGSNLLEGQSVLGEHITGTCLENGNFDYSGEEVNFHSLRCQRIPENTIKYTGRSCTEGGEEIEIGYEIPDEFDSFVAQIRVCFDNSTFSPVYSQYTLTSNIGYRDGGVPRKFFEEDGFYSTFSSLDTLYRRDVERRTINSLLGLDYASDRYIKNQGDERFINRGHLTAKGDFVYGFQQLATFHYVNSAPQWASFNGGNWNELEISLRDLAASSDTNFEVYTGIYGISSLKHASNGAKVKLHLHTENNKNLLPIPQLFWKLIHSKRNGRAIVIVGVNNAYEIDISSDVVCNDVSDQVSWFNGKLRNQKRSIKLGYTYACSVEDFCRQTNVCPNLDPSGLLL